MQLDLDNDWVQIKRVSINANPFLKFCAVLNKVDTFPPKKLESVMKSTTKRTQRDYSLAFKLTV
ncbi:hypothetical protein R7D64_12225, partial [Vibrio sp. Vb2535]|uniref:hypothetical protein n=1 Tax=Vibrio sp. Vb2535 TaxID=3074667 RepID=UPI00296422DB